MGQADLCEHAGCAGCENYHCRYNGPVAREETAKRSKDLFPCHSLAVWIKRKIDVLGREGVRL